MARSPRVTLLTSAVGASPLGSGWPMTAYGRRKKFKRQWQIGYYFRRLAGAHGHSPWQEELQLQLFTVQGERQRATMGRESKRRKYYNARLPSAHPCARAPGKTVKPTAAVAGRVDNSSEGELRPVSSHFHRS